MQNVHHNKHTKKQKARQLWKPDVAWFMRAAGYGDIADKFLSCETSYFVDVCKAHPEHDPKPIPRSCKFRFCIRCEHRESYRKLKRYIPALEKLSRPNPEYPDFALWKLCLTTPYSLASMTAEKFKLYQGFVNLFFSVFFFWYFYEKGELSKAEVRSARCNLRQHGVGWLCAAEFGERGKKLHWHCLVYGPFMYHPDVCAIWKDVTDGVCQNALIQSIYADPDGEIDGVSALEGALSEIVKYATKFSELPAQDVPHLYEVLKGNRRFRSGGILNGLELPDSEEIDRKCECGADRELLSVGQYVTRCQNRNVPVDDIVAEAVESGIALYLRLSTELEITSGKSPALYRKARDSIAKDG